MMFRIILIVILTFLAMGAAFKEQVLSGNMQHEEFINFTEKIRYDNLNMTDFNNLSNNQNSSIIPRMVFKYADFLMFATLEGGNKAIEYGYEHPQYDYRFMMWLIVISCLAFLVIPTIIILMFLGFGIYYLVIWIKKFKWRKK